MKITAIPLASLILVILGITYAQSVRPTAPQAIPGNAQSAGRYQIVFSPFARADTFLVDTQTGKIWQRTSYSFLVGEPDAWLFQTRIDDEQEELVWKAAHTHK